MFAAPVILGNFMGVGLDNFDTVKEIANMNARAESPHNNEGTIPFLFQGGKNVFFVKIKIPTKIKQRPVEDKE